MVRIMRCHRENMTRVSAPPPPKKKPPSSTCGDDRAAALILISKSPFHKGRGRFSLIRQGWGNQQHDIIGWVFFVRDAMKCYFCFRTLQSRHCRTLLRSQMNNSDASRLCDRTGSLSMFNPSSSAPFFSMNMF